MSGRTPQSMVEVEERLSALETLVANRPGSHLDGRLAVGQWNDLRVPLAGLQGGGAKAPTYLQWRDDGAGSTGVYGYSFSNVSEEELFFEAQLPHSYMEGTRLGPHAHMVISNAPVTGETVRLGFEYTYANVWGVFPETVTAYGEYTFTDDNSQYQQVIVAFPDIEDPAMAVSAMLSCRVFRDAGHVNDDYSDEVVLLEVDFHHMNESLGSAAEFSK